MRRLLALMLSASLASTGCATAMASHNDGSRISAPKAGAVDPKVMADYIRQLPVGSKVRLVQSDGTVMRAILMKHDADPIVVQRRTRIPEAPIEIPIADIVAMELDTHNGGTGKTIAIGAASAVGATLGVLMLLAAIFAD